MKIEIRKDQNLLKSVMEATGLSSDFILKVADEYDVCANAGNDPIPRILDAMKSERYLKYNSNATKQAIVRSALTKTHSSDLEGDPFDEVVIVFGGVDRNGKDPKKNPPMHYIALKKNKQLVRIKSWDKDLFSVLPCKARVVGTFTTNAQWGDAIVPDEYSGVSDVEMIDSETLQKALMKVAMTPEMCGNVSSDLVKYNVPYAITGKIQWVNPCTKWVDGELDDKGYELLYDDEGTPTKKGIRCSISLEGNGSGVGLSAVLDTAKTRHPIVMIDDFETLATDAYESNPTTPKKQGLYLKDVLSGREIIAVGTMSRMSSSNTLLYVDFSSVFLMECNPDIKPVNETPKLDEFKKEEPAPEDSSLTPEQKIVAAIVESSRVNGVKDPSFIPVDKLRAIASIGEEYDDNTVRQFAKAAEAQLKM